MEKRRDKFIKSAVLTLSVFETQSCKTKPVFAPGREFYSLTYRHYGSVTLESDTERLVSGPDCITFMPKGFSYQTEILEDMKMTAIHFTLAEDPGIHTAHVLPAGDSPLYGMFRELMQKYNVSDPLNFECMSLFYRILAEVEHLGKICDTAIVPAKIVEAKRLIDHSFSSPDLSIALLAERLQISDSYLRREFKKAFGESPVSYLKKIRINNAKTLLDSNYYTITQISRKSGYSSVSYFIQSFHRETGMTPTNYQTREHF